MSWTADTLEAFKAWLGATTPPADDATLTRALGLALATLETYLDRPLEKAERTQDDYNVGGVILLRAWPVESVATIDAGGVPIAFDPLRLDKRTGRLGVPCWYGATSTKYTGGFEPMPIDLEHALWMIAAALVPAVQSAAGAEAGQPIIRVSTPDVGTVEFARASSSGGAADRLLGATLSPQVESLVQRYRAESVVGGA